MPHRILTLAALAGLGLAGALGITQMTGGSPSIATPAAAGPRVEMVSARSCLCCRGWREHMEAAGYRVENAYLAAADLYAAKAEAGFRQKHASCHTAKVGGYAIEGHVPAAEVDRLFAEKPDAVGLAVPGMPADAPGMGDGDTPYDVLLIRADGSSEVFASYPQ